MVNSKTFITAEDLSEIMDISKGHAYKIIHMLNEELQAEGYMTVSGRIPRKYLEKRCYGVDEEVHAV